MKLCITKVSVGITRALIWALVDIKIEHYLDITEY